MAVVARGSAGGVDLELELERADLLPGRLVAGVLRATFRASREVRGAYVTLRGEEYWQYERTETDAQGHTRTRTVTAREELRRVPVQLTGAAAFAAGEIREFPFELPVPPLGPPTVVSTVLGATWEIEGKVDVSGFDPAVVLPVRVLQPTAALRAGTVPVGQFALWESAAADAGEVRATIALDPVPLCLGAPFGGRLTIDADRSLELQEIRLELRVRAVATVDRGKDEELTVWTGRLAGPGALGSGPRTIDFRDVLPMADLPTARLPHGETDATFRVVLARAWAPDPNLVRDVAVCSTTEL